MSLTIQEEITTNQHEELRERRLKRIAVVEKHRDTLNAMIIGKQKAIRWRKHFHFYVFHVAYMEFQTEEQEYNHIGKPGRMRWSDHHEHQKAFGRYDPFRSSDRMHGVIGDIMREFGCFDY
jgi:hypothetical protein